MASADPIIFALELIDVSFKMEDFVLESDSILVGNFEVAFITRT